MPSSQKIKRAVVAHDLHFPLVNWPAWNAMMQVVKDIKPEYFVFAGDAFDNNEISHHNAGKPIYQERRSFLRNQETFDEKILTPLEAILPKACEKTYIIGNHERFEWDFVEKHPELEGIIDHVAGLELEDRGWDIVPLGHAKVIGDLNIIHGEVLSGTGNQASGTPARKAVDLYGGNVLAGHTHAPQSFTKISPVSHKKKYMGWIAPILGDCNPSYLRNRPTGWLNGFTLVEFYGKHFNLYPIIIIDGELSYGGKHYSGN